jgi:hypothetical protein
MNIWQMVLPGALGVGLFLGVSLDDAPDRFGGSTRSAVAVEPADPCDLLFVPEGYGLTCIVERPSAGTWRLAVRPEDSAFAALSELTVEPVEEPAGDSQEWLRDQLRIDLSGLEDAVRDLTDSDDSPFSDEEFAASIEAWLEMMTMLGDWPLNSCTEPMAVAAEERSELACVWQLGPFVQHLQVRLVERDGQHYLVHARAMNERRLRHLVAIANSL